MTNPALSRVLRGPARLVLAAILILISAGWLMAHDAAPARPAFTHGTLTVTDAAGQAHVYRVEVARSDAEQAYGLMFRTHLKPDEGMIFPYDPPREVAFWMKNTLIPLDMLFIAPGGQIGHIVANAIPNDVTPIPSTLPIDAVVEIKGGEAAIDGIAEGDHVVFTPAP